MKRLALKLAASSLALVLATAGSPLGTVSFGPARASANEARAEERAARFQRDARQALARGDIAAAVAAAEEAVALAPRDVGYRMLLGDVYMRSGRFQSAEIAYRDVLTLDPGQTRVAISLALMQVANGRGADAIARLEGLEGRASPADLGLAYALAGAPQRGVDILEPAARTMSASARVRQNLALAYAIGGDWNRARTIAAQDLSPAEIGERMTQWASLTRSPGDHVAALLGVSPAQDPGQPVRLALNAPAAPQVEEAPRVAFAQVASPRIPFAAAAPAAPIQIPVAEAAPEAPEVPMPLPAMAAVAAPVAVELPTAQAELEQPDWGLADNGSVRLPAAAPEIQQLPAPVQYAAAADALVSPVPAAAPVRARPPRQAVRALEQVADAPARAAAAPRRSAAGRYVVQIGAFSSAANAERAWQDAERRFGLRSEEPVTMTFGHNGRLLHRVAIAGFDNRAGAGRLCATIRARGGACFVRSNAGDAAIRWAARYSRRA